MWRRIKELRKRKGRKPQPRREDSNLECSESTEAAEEENPRPTFAKPQRMGHCLPSLAIAGPSIPSGGIVRPLLLAILWRRDRATISEVTASFQRARASEHPVRLEPDSSGPCP